MKVLIVGDLHLRAKKLKDISKAWQDAIAFGRSQGVDCFVQAGDVFDHANVYGREASTGTIYDALLTPFEHRPIPLYVIPGNHDIGSPKDKDALTPVDKYEWITVIRKPCVYDIGNNVSLCAVPWLNRSHLIQKLLAKNLTTDQAMKKVDDLLHTLMGNLGKEVAKAKADGKFVLLVGHLEVTGAAREGGTVQSEGSFEFSPVDLAAVGANAYALAHIHIRQHIDGLPNQNDGYIGSLCQLSFGEQGHTVGCRIIDVKDGRIASDDWHNNEESPKYFTVNSLAGLNYRKGVDYVKLRGITRPDELPPGVIFDRIPQAVNSRVRANELSCDMSLRDLLNAWKNVEKCPVELEKLVAGAEELYRHNQTSDEAIGSLDRINRIHLKNLTCHTDSEIGLGFTGICGLSGPNGTGKTTAIEAIMLALYGQSPSRPKLPTLIPGGDSVESSVEVHFESGGKKYFARRNFKKTAKTFNHKAYVFEGDNDKDPVAGPNVEDATAYCSRLVGDPELVLAGIFSAQGDAGNLIKLLPSERKDIFAKLLGSERFFVLGEAAKKVVGKDGASLESHRSRIETLKIELSDESLDVAEVTRLKQEIAKKQEEAKRLEDKVQKATEEIQALEIEKRDRDTAKTKLTSLEAKKAQIQAEGRELKKKKEALQALDSSKVEADLAAARETRAEYDRLMESINAERELQAKKLDEARDLVLKADKMAAARNKEWHSYLLELSRQKQTVEKDRRSKAVEISNKISKVKTLIAQAETSIELAKEQTESLKGFPDLEACKTCPLAAGSLAARDSIPETEAKIQEYKAKLEKGEGVLKAHEEETASLINAIVPMPEQDFQPEVLLLCEDTIIKSNILKAEANAARSSELQAKVAALKKTMDTVPALEKELEKISASKAEIGKIDGLLEAARNSFREVDLEIKAIVIPDFAEDKYGIAKSRLDTAKGTLSSHNSDIGTLNMTLGGAKMKVDQHDVRRKEIQRLTNEIGSKLENVEIHDALAKAFGRDGIPQLIVDSTIPHLQDIIYDLMSECDGKWTVRISSQHQNKDGSMKEQIDILVDDGTDERDILTYSGGETNMLAVIIRIAFSILLSERSGKGLKVLVLDEAMYFADGENSDTFIRMMRRLPKYFNQVLLVSHSDYILSSIQNKIYFARGSNGTLVQLDFGETN